MIYVAMILLLAGGLSVGFFVGVAGMSARAERELDLIRKRLVMEQIGWPKVDEILRRARKELC